MNKQTILTGQAWPYHPHPKPTRVRNLPTVLDTTLRVLSKLRLQFRHLWRSPANLLSTTDLSQQSLGEVEVPL